MTNKNDVESGSAYLTKVSDVSSTTGSDPEKVDKKKFNDARDNDIDLDEERSQRKKTKYNPNSNKFSIIAGTVATVMFLGGVAAVGIWQYNNKEDLINQLNEYFQTDEKEQEELDELQENEQYGTYEMEVSSVIEMDQDADGEDYLEDEKRSGEWVDSYVN